MQLMLGATLRGSPSPALYLLHMPRHPLEFLPALTLLSRYAPGLLYGRRWGGNQQHYRFVINLDVLFSWLNSLFGAEITLAQSQ